MMLEVIIALVPASLAGIYFFGMPALFLTLNCIFSAVASEWIVLKIRKKTLALNDFSAALTGLLLALILPPTLKWYAATLGAIFAIVVGKHVFGGLGSNIFNPALLGRAFLMAAYPAMLNHYIMPRSVDTITAATPLTMLKYSPDFQESAIFLKDLFWGNVAGSVGETSAFLLLLGGLYLLIRKVADFRIPLPMLFTVIIISSLVYLKNSSLGSPVFHLFSGGLMIGAFFMATDPVTTPTTKKGRYIFAVSTGALTMLLRYFSSLPEGVMYSILFMNAFTPLINRYTRQKSFGKESYKTKKQ
ncbi:MAG: RnfABCDGE type electron transport complex subunit D [Candidatus Omnitrophica bacterium]|nr:RnfABCDGE type electron transport complex subunit D [Candidatus Omnitrophota bacterium]